MTQFSLSKIDFRVLSVFVNVVENGGFSATAISNNTSLSSVTRDVSALEKRLKLQLCLRGRSGFSLTEQGEEIYAAAKQLLGHVRNFENQVSETRDFLPGALEIGLIDNMATDHANGIISTLSKLNHENPNLTVRISTHPMSAIDMLVSERLVDIGFCGYPERLTPLTYIYAYSEELRFFVSRNCPDYDRIMTAVSIDQLKEELPYVARADTSNDFARFESLLPLVRTAFGTNPESVLAAVLAGLGCAVLPVHIAEKFSELDPVPLVQEALMAPFHLAVRTDSLEHKAIKDFILHYQPLQNTEQKS